MHFIFFRNYEHLSKLRDYAMYYGIQAKETRGVTNMKIWFQMEMDKHVTKSSFELCLTFIGRAFGLPSTWCAL